MKAALVQGGRRVTTGEKTAILEKLYLHTVLTRLLVQWPPYAIEVQALELAPWSTCRMSPYDIMNDM